MKKLLLKIFLILSLFASASNGQDVNFFMSKTSIENSLAAFITARGAGYFEYGSNTLSYKQITLFADHNYPINVALNPSDNTITLRCGYRARADVDYLFRWITAFEGSAVLRGKLEMTGSAGKLILKPIDITFDGEGTNFLGRFAAPYINIIVYLINEVTVPFSIPAINSPFFVSQSPTIQVVNDGILIGWQSKHATLVVDQVGFDGQRLINSKIGHWGNSQFMEYTVPAVFTKLPFNSIQAIKADQSIINSQKFHDWNSTLYQNFYRFENNGSLNYLTAQFSQTHQGVTIKNNLENTGVNAGQVGFKDPWLLSVADTRYPNPAGGYYRRNQDSTELSYKFRPSPFTPDYSTNYSGDVYQGVFLNQSSNQDRWVQKHYSLSAEGGVNSPIVTTIPLTNKQHKFYFQNWSTTAPNTAEFSAPNTNETHVSFLSPNASIIANFKGIHLSESVNAFKNNGQRKVAYKSSNQTQYMVYESAGNIWWEYLHSSSNGWSMPGTKLTAGKNASISGDAKYIVVQTDNSIEVYNNTYATPSTPTLFPASSLYFDPGVQFGNPVISVNQNGRVLLVFQYNDGSFNGLAYFIGTPIYQSGSQSAAPIEQIPVTINWLYPDNLHKISGTSYNSKNPTIDNSGNQFHLAYEENGQIKYLNMGELNNYTNASAQVVSQYSGFTTNTNPSIIGFSSSGARLSWVGSRTSYYWDEEEQQSGPATVETKAVFNDPSNISRLWSWSNNVNSVSINKHADVQPGYVIAWGRSNTEPVQSTDNTTLSVIKTYTGLTGKDVQLGGATTKGTMQVYAFNSGTPTGYFGEKQVYEGLQKTDAESFSQSREGIVAKDTAQFYFALGDVTVNGRKVNFVNVPDSANVNDNTILNNYLTTEPFSVNNNSTLTYGVMYGITDSLSAMALLKDNHSVNFKVEIVSENGAVVATFDNVSYDSVQAYQYNNLSREVNLDGIGEQAVRVRLVVTTNNDFTYSLKNSYATEDVMQLGKRGVKSTKFSDLNKVKTYSLSQNYPNPFNPSTTIAFEVPKSGMVTLKVYDVLGGEIMTLVNEMKEVGKHSISFDASNLPSGVYFYKLTSGDFVSTKKMVLVK